MQKQTHKLNTYVFNIQKKYMKNKKMVRVKGLEPSRLAARASKTRVSASFTIPATVIMLPYINLFVNSFYKMFRIFFLANINYLI